MQFTCNVCGSFCEPPAELSRELESCAVCGSTVRLRALIALLSREMFGVLMALPEFPVLEGIRGIGMSDAPGLADRLSEKFDYTNTFFHQAPRFDVTNPAESDRGRYDFILSSEVMEHVPPPVERAFTAMHAMLKPDALLLLTTPYSLGGRTAEHFPQLHQYTLAELGGRTVLINRRRDGGIETFENLVFHGGHGSTLEMRCFTEDSLRAILSDSGFDSVHFAAENDYAFGIEHSEAWSLPIAARKGNLRPPAGELALQYREACRLAARKSRDLAAITAEYERHSAHHLLAYNQWTKESEQRIAWTRKVEADWEQRTQWALEIEREKNNAISEFNLAKASEAEAWKAAAELSQQLDQAQATLAQLTARKWIRLGRKLGVID